MRAALDHAEPRCRWASLSDLSVSRGSGRFARIGGPDRAVCANRFRYNAGEPPPAAGLPLRRFHASTFRHGNSRRQHGCTFAISPPRRRRHLVNRMKLVAWIIRIVLFALLFVLALRNTADVSLQLFFDAVWRAPLILILLAFFVLGALAALISVAPSLMRQRLEIARLRRAVGNARTPADDGAGASSPKAVAPYNVIGPKV